MATVVADMSMSLDGFIAGRNDEVGPLLVTEGARVTHLTYRVRRK